MKQRTRMKRVSERAYRRSRHGPVCRAKRVPRIVHRPEGGELVGYVTSIYWTRSLQGSMSRSANPTEASWRYTTTDWFGTNGGPDEREV
jgi:hypothetical protein